jgi:hypothetical protein
MNVNKRNNGRKQTRGRGIEKYIMYERAPWKSRKAKEGLLQSCYGRQDNNQQKNYDSGKIQSDAIIFCSWRMPSSATYLCMYVDASKVCFANRGLVDNKFNLIVAFMAGKESNVFLCQSKKLVWSEGQYLQ